MGLSVCSVFAAAYLIKERDLDCKTALKWIKRKCGAKPNPGFVLQLEQFALVTRSAQIKKLKQIEANESATRLMTGQSSSYLAVVH